MTVWPSSYTTTSIPSFIPDPCNCGVCPGSDGDVKDNNCWNAHLKIHFEDSSKFISCGGTLIDSVYVLTSAHCVTIEDQTIDFISVKFGIRQLNNTFDVQEFESREFYVYSNENVLDNDIALIKLDSPVPFDSESSIRPICLPASNSVST